MPTFQIKQNDTSPSIIINLKDADGAARNITGNTGARFHMRESGGATKIDAAITVNDAATGECQYNWQAADTDTAGTYEAEVEITFADGTIETFPNNSYITVTITDDIA